MKTANRRQILKFGLGAMALPLVATATKAGGHATHRVEIKSFAFEPAILEMEAGDKVTFVNLDSAPHTATADNKSFDTGRLGKGDEVTVEIKESGKIGYFCTVHPNMRGEIVAS